MKRRLLLHREIAKTIQSRWQPGCAGPQTVREISNNRSERPWVSLTLRLRVSSFVGDIVFVSPVFVLDGSHNIVFDTPAFFCFVILSLFLIALFSMVRIILSLRRFDLVPYGFHSIVSWPRQFCPGSFLGIFSLWLPLSLGTFLGTWLFLYFPKRDVWQGISLAFPVLLLVLFLLLPFSGPRCWGRGPLDFVSPIITTKVEAFDEPIAR